ncbi:MAG TPA: glycosyltransferase family 9 protein [Caulobacterales bacterium]|nr:glycosyltransferase family 9 protein [Caulobacterales bacterium]
MIFKKKTQAKAAPSAAKRVLVIKMGGLADFVQMLAAAKAIREYHFGARITLLTAEPFRVMAEKCPYFDTVETDAAIRPPTVGESATTAVGAQSAKEEQPIIVQLISRVRAAKYDMVYDLENSRRTSAIYQGLRPWPPLWCGAAPGASHPFKDAGGQHNLDRLAAQLQSAGIELKGPLLPDFSWVRVALRDAPRLSPDYFGIRGRYVLLAPRGADVGPKRRWPPEKYVQLARTIAAQGVTPVVLGGQEERGIGTAIAQAERHAKNLVMRPDLFQSAALAERASFAVGDDVDLLHVAAAAGAPCLVFVSSRDDVELRAPRGPGGVVALTAAVVADIPVEQVDRQIRNCGVYVRAATA